MIRKLTVNGMLLATVLPLLLATIVGLVVLWPDGHSARPTSFGPAARLINGTVEADRVVPCKGGASGAANNCRVATVRLTKGPEKGDAVDLELYEGPGQPRLHAGIRWCWAGP